MMILKFEPMSLWFAALALLFALQGVGFWLVMWATGAAVDLVTDYLDGGDGPGAYQG